MSEHSFRKQMLSLVGAAAIGIVGCAESIDFTEPENADAGPIDVSADPLSNLTNGPLSPGPIIVRIPNSGSRVVTTDPARGLMAIHGKVDGLAECTDASTRVPVDIQIVSTPSDAHGISLVLVGSENDVAIYGVIDLAAVAPFDETSFCMFITENDPLYVGTVHYVANINGQGALNFRWQGFLTETATGSQHSYVENQHLVFTGSGIVKQVVEDILIH